PIEPPNLLPSVFISYLTVGDPVALVAIKSEISFHPQYLNGVDRYGNTPLMIAAEHSHDDIVRALLELGADKTVRNNAGHTALDIAHASEALANDLQRIARLEDIITMLNQG
ncbi:MAG: ankyrin repeat domain-containing protein, partial [Candidatus Babeliales bacterium]|nr:ankyrin repeat domain-containing protein [Candidatus Babeliales bacterium]